MGTENSGTPVGLCEINQEEGLYEINQEVPDRVSRSWAGPGRKLLQELQWSSPRAWAGRSRQVSGVNLSWEGGNDRPQKLTKYQR